MVSRFEQLPHELHARLWPHLDYPADFISLRHTCRTLAALAAGPLFETATVSSCNLDRLLELGGQPAIAHLVKEIHYLDTPFTTISEEALTPAWDVTHSGGGIKDLLAVLNGSYSQPDDSQVIDQHLDLDSQNHIPCHVTDEENRGVLQAIWREYREKAKWQGSDMFLSTFISALKRLPNVIRITISEERQRDKNRGSKFTTLAYLKRLHNHFPLSEAACYNFLGQFEPGLRPYSLVLILQALVKLGRTMTYLAVESNGFIKRGIHYPVLVEEGDHDLEFPLAAFKYISKLKLCISASDTMWRSRADIASCAVGPALTSARKTLESLDIELTGTSHELFTVRLTAFKHIIPQGTIFENLQSLSLASLWVSEDILTSFLFTQPALKHLRLAHIQLRGHWASAIARWSANVEFLLSSIELVSILDNTPWDMADGPHDREGERVGVRVPNEEVLAYINHGSHNVDLVNPFEKRKWFYFNRKSRVRFNLPLDDNYDGGNDGDSQCSDMSSWSINDYPSDEYPELYELTDPDGLAYHSDCEMDESDQEVDVEDNIDQMDVDEPEPSFSPSKKGKFLQQMKLALRRK